MKVSQVIISLDKSIGGPARSLPTMCIGLKNLNVCSDVLTYQSKNPNVESLIEKGIGLHFAEKENSLWGKFCSTSFVKLLEVDVDIIHIHSLWAWPLHCVSRFAQRNVIPVVWSPRGTLESWSLRQKRIKKWMALFLYQRTDLQNSFCIHATSVEEANSIRRLGLKNPIAIIPNGINISNYPMKMWDKNPQKKRTLSFLSRIHPKKGIELLLEAWSKMPSEILKSWNVRIAGEGELRYVNHVRKLLSTKYAKFDIEMVGPKYGKEKIDFLHQTDVFILPTYSENFGVAIAEAMACGIPVITTKGAPWKILEERNIGWYTETNVDALVKTLVSALSIELSLLENKGKQSRKIIEENYTMEAVANNYKLLYEWIAGGTKEKPVFVYE